MPRVGTRALTDDERSLLHAKLRDKTLSVRVWERYRIIGELSNGRSPGANADAPCKQMAGRIDGREVGCLRLPCHGEELQETNGLRRPLDPRRRA